MRRQAGLDGMMESSEQKLHEDISIRDDDEDLTISVEDFYDLLMEQ